jgi:hypothetical protein
MKEVAIGWTCCLDGENKCIHNFENISERNILESGHFYDRGDVWIILSKILGKHCENVKWMELAMFVSMAGLVLAALNL